MTKYLLSKLAILSTIALAATPLLAIAAPEPTLAPTAQSNTSQPTIASLDVTLQQNPKDVDAYLQRGILHARLQQNIPAIADYTEVIRLDPNHALAYNNRAAAKLNMKDYRGAVLDYNEVIRILPEQAITYNNRAYARHQAGDCKGAIADLRIAIELFRIYGDNFNYQRSIANLKQFQRAKR
jgi:tetratricopeptide (TPR) repeat protein